MSRIQSHRMVHPKLLVSIDFSRPTGYAPWRGGRPATAVACYPPCDLSVKARTAFSRSSYGSHLPRPCGELTARPCTGPYSRRGDRKIMLIFCFRLGLSPTGFPYLAVQAKAEADRPAAWAVAVTALTAPVPP